MSSPGKIKCTNTEDSLSNQINEKFPTDIPPQDPSSPPGILSRQERRLCVVGSPKIDFSFESCFDFSIVVKFVFALLPGIRKGWLVRFHMWVW
ncbi:hypothetical protein NC651_020744 [Populus alba x Populus x berolinensis]|nr:hypothetical protein NC651_020744 [Populus alba x Populus x berolinensis]